MIDRLSRRRFTQTLGGALLAGTVGARPVAFPERPMRMIVPAAVGSPADLIARQLVDALEMHFEQAVHLENRPGGGGIIAAQLVARAPGDGHTLLFTHSSSLLDNLFPYRRPPIEPLRDLTLLTQVASAPLALVVHPDLPSTDGPRLLEHVADVTEPLAYGSSGVGTHAHLAGAMIGQAAAVSLTHVPYRAEQPMLRALAGDHIQLAFASAAAARSMAETGRVRVVGVTGERRATAFPEMPTLVERGLDEAAFRVSGWLGLALPAGVPMDIVDELDAAVQAACLDAAFGRLARQLGLDTIALSHDAFRARFAQELPLWAQLAAQASRRWSIE